MAQYFTSIIKPQVQANLEAAGVTGAAAKHIMKFERAMCTVRNHRDGGMSTYRLQEGGFTDLAYNLLCELNEEGGFGMLDTQYWKEWVAYCEVNGTCPDANMGDMMA